MEPKNNTSVADNFQSNVSINFLTIKVTDKNSELHNKNFSEKKCVHRTENGFCKLSNKQCRAFIF